VIFNLAIDRSKAAESKKLAPDPGLWDDAKLEVMVVQARRKTSTHNQADPHLPAFFPYRSTKRHRSSLVRNA
jgi:hypothetical protein